MTDSGPNQTNIFMTRARRRLSPNAYDRLTQILGMCRMGVITRSTAHAQATTILAEFPELLEDFRVFLPEEEPPKSILGRVQRGLKKLKEKVVGGRRGSH